MSTEEEHAMEQERRRQEDMAREAEEYDRLMWCEQSGQMVEGDACHCGKVTTDITGKERGR